MSQNTVPPSSKFTLKSKDSAKLLGGLTSVYRSFREPKGSELDKEENSRFSGSSLGPTLVPEATESSGPSPEVIGPQ